MGLFGEEISCIVFAAFAVIRGGQFFSIWKVWLRNIWVVMGVRRSPSNRAADAVPSTAANTASTSASPNTSPSKSISALRLNFHGISSTPADATTTPAAGLLPLSKILFLGLFDGFEELKLHSYFFFLPIATSAASVCYSWHKTRRNSEQKHQPTAASLLFFTLSFFYLVCLQWRLHRRFASHREKLLKFRLALGALTGGVTAWALSASASRYGEIPHIFSYYSKEVGHNIMQAATQCNVELAWPRAAATVAPLLLRYTDIAARLLLPLFFAAEAALAASVVEAEASLMAILSNKQAYIHLDLQRLLDKIQLPWRVEQLLPAVLYSTPLLYLPHMSKLFIHATGQSAVVFASLRFLLCAVASFLLIFRARAAVQVSALLPMRDLLQETSSRNRLSSDKNTTNSSNKSFCRAGEEVAFGGTENDNNRVLADVSSSVPSVVKENQHKKSGRRRSLQASEAALCLQRINRSMIFRLLELLVLPCKLLLLICCSALLLLQNHQMQIDTATETDPPAVYVHSKVLPTETVPPSSSSRLNLILENEQPQLLQEYPEVQQQSQQQEQKTNSINDGGVAVVASASALPNELPATIIANASKTRESERKAEIAEGTEATAEKGPLFEAEEAAFKGSSTVQSADATVQAKTRNDSLLAAVGESGSERENREKDARTASAAAVRAESPLCSFLLFFFGDAQKKRAAFNATGTLSYKQLVVGARTAAGFFSPYSSTKLLNIIQGLIDHLLFVYLLTAALLLFCARARIKNAHGPTLFSIWDSTVLSE